MTTVTVGPNVPTNDQKTALRTTFDIYSKDEVLNASQTLTNKTLTGAALNGTLGATTPAAATVTTLTTSGHLAVRSNPSAWAAGASAVEYGAFCSIFQNASGYPNMAFNVYQDSTNTYVYKVSSNSASMYQQTNGTHYWFSAPDGVAGQGISFTNNMSLTPGGDLRILGSNSIGNSDGTTNWAPSGTSGTTISNNGKDAYVTTYLDDSSITIGSGVTQKTGITIRGQTHPLGSAILARVGGSNVATVSSSGLAVVGNVGIGTPNPLTKLHVNEASTNPNFALVGNNNNGLAVGMITSTLPGIGAYSGDTVVYGGGLNSTFVETMRTSGGSLLVNETSSNGTNIIRKDIIDQQALIIRNNQVTRPYGALIQFGNSSPNNTTQYFLRCEDSTVGRFLVFSNGNVTNTNNSYGAISDIKLKENIVDTSPKLQKLLKVRIVNYNLKTDPEHKQIGVIAQELEDISPGLIEESPDFEEVEVEAARTEVQTKQRQKTTKSISTTQEIKLVNGKWTKVNVEQEVQTPVTEELPLFNEDGSPVTEVVTPATDAIPAVAEVKDADGNVITPASKAIKAKPAVMKQSTHNTPVMEDYEVTIDVPAKKERKATGTFTKSVKYSVFVPMLIKGMQEQQDIIDGLTKRIEALEAKK